MREMQGHIPPQSVDLEKALLGALLLERDKLEEVAALIQSPKVFYTPAHQVIYGDILEMLRTGQPVDLVTVTGYLSKKNKLQQVGGGHYMAELTMEVVSSAHAVNYALSIQEKFIRRELIRIASNVVSRAYDETVDVLDLYDETNAQLAQTIQISSVDDWKSMAQAAVELTQHMETVRGKDVVGITTGFQKLDRRNGGFSNGSLNIIGARPSVGKSALMGNMVMSMARTGVKVGVMSLEMPTKDIFGRMVSSETMQSFENINFNRLDEGSMIDVLQKMGELSNLPVYFSDTAKVNILDITNKAHSLRKKHGLEALFIDYLQLVEEMPGEKGNRENSVSKISRGLKTLAMTLQIPIIALCQLNREMEKRADKRPQLSDLRESGAIEQDADVVMFLHRPWRMGIEKDEHGESTEFKAELICPKWRNGAPVNLDLHFEPSTMTFSEYPPVKESQEDNPYTIFKRPNNDNAPF